jgi:hypothetical protein
MHVRLVQEAEPFHAVPGTMVTRHGDRDRRRFEQGRRGGEGEPLEQRRQRRGSTQATTATEDDPRAEHRHRPGLGSPDAVDESFASPLLAVRVSGADPEEFEVDVT